MRVLNPRRLFVTVGTGVGGGLILDGKLRLGAFGAAGELGHHTILPDGPVCGCGNRGCLETLISGPVLTLAGQSLMGSGHAPILSELVQGDATRVTPLQMSIAADNGDDSVSNAIQHAVEYLGIGIANAVSITAVETVVLGGGLSALGERLLGPVRKAILNRVKMFPSEHVKVRVSSLGENAGALGAAVLTMIESKRLESTALRCNYGDRR